MGRKKIAIKKISDEKLRNVTFNKRKMGLLKKAAELCILCGVDMFLAFKDMTNRKILFKNYNVKNPKDLLVSEFDFNEKSYPDFIPKNGKKFNVGEMEDSEDKNSDIVPDKKEKINEVAQQKVQEQMNYRTRHSITSQFTFDGNFKEEHIGGVFPFNFGETQPIDNRRNSFGFVSRRPTYSFDNGSIFGTHPNNQKTEKGQPKSRMSSIDMTNFPNN